MLLPGHIVALFDNPYGAAMRVENGWDEDISGLESESRDGGNKEGEDEGELVELHDI